MFTPVLDISFVNRPRGKRMRSEPLFYSKFYGFQITLKINPLSTKSSKIKISEKGCRLVLHQVEVLE
jgi:hypothetical protein